MISEAARTQHLETLTHVRRLCEEAFPNAKRIVVEDCTPMMSVGKGAHIRLDVQASELDNLGIIQRHKRLNNLFKDDIEANRIHAISYGPGGTPK